ncbi:FAD-binding oxidoreductase [Streptomyces sp. NPDC054956]
MWEIPGFAGRLITPHDTEYDEARALWNGAIDRRPAAIARCGAAADVQAVVRYARGRGLSLSVRGGGHGVGGNAVCDGGLVADLSGMRTVEADPRTRTATAAGGVLWGELDRATHRFGLATTGGIVTHTGIAGLTLGGGLGWLMRAHGLAVDNLLHAELVTADGELITTRDRPELLWALRGGGGNFGAVTAFRYRLHPVSGVLGGPVLWALEDAPGLLRHYRDWIADVPDELTTIVGLRKAPALPALPEEIHGRLVCVINSCWCGPPEAGAAVLAPLRAYGHPLADLTAVRPYPEHQAQLDAVAPHGWHYYWKSCEVATLDDDLIDVLVEHTARVGSPRSYTLVFHLGGAIAGVPEDATAYPHRTAGHAVIIDGAWPAEEPVTDRETAWVRDFFHAVEPHQVGVYVNFLGNEGRDRVLASYGEAKYRELVRIKRIYDPDNVFRHNQNIDPSRAPLMDARSGP